MTKQEKLQRQLIKIGACYGVMEDLQHRYTSLHQTYHHVSALRAIWFATRVLGISKITPVLREALLLYARNFDETLFQIAKDVEDINDVAEIALQWDDAAYQQWKFMCAAISPYSDASVATADRTHGLMCLILGQRQTKTLANVIRKLIPFKKFVAFVEGKWKVR